MKVYLFESESGVYAGEDFCAAAEVRENDGITAIAPPDHRPGHVPLFDRSSGAWKVVPAADLELG